MTISIFLNIVALCIIGWFPLNEYWKYVTRKKIKNPVHIYNGKMFSTEEKKYTVVVIMYLLCITILWILYLFDISELVNKHLFSFVYPIFIIILTSRKSINISLGEEGVAIGYKFYKWEDIEFFSVEEIGISQMDYSSICEIKVIGNNKHRGYIDTGSENKLKEIISSHYKG